MEHCLNEEFPAVDSSPLPGIREGAVTSRSALHCSCAVGSLPLARRYLALDSIDFHIVYLVLSWLTCYTVSIKIPLHKTVFALFVILKFIFVK